MMMIRRAMSGRPIASASLSWAPRDLWQFDIGTVIGLDGDSDDAEFYIGLSTLF